MAPPYLRLAEKRDFSRLLYANPVCFLVTRRPDGAGSGLNAMTISWLTCVNNSGTFAFSLHTRRFTAACLLACPEFVLSVPCRGMEPLVLAVGQASGRRGDKFEQLASEGLAIDVSAVAFAEVDKVEQDAVPLSSSNSGGGPETPAKPAAALGPVRGTVAWLRATAVSIGVGDADHHLVVAQAHAAAVHPRYWNGKHFAPVPGTGAPPYLAFLGSQTLAYTEPAAPAAGAKPSFPPVLAPPACPGPPPRSSRSNKKKSPRS
jgi:flavin reductase (DIM6/NTAB) family NADH-FMN oxidoreductase RutF